MDARNSILMSLPNRFTRADFLDKAGSQTAYSLSYIQQLLDEAVLKSQIRRVERGVYEKVEQKQPQTA